MKRIILPVLVLSLLGITAAGAYPTPRTGQATSSELLVEVGHKGKGKGHHHGNKHGHKYKHGHAYKHGGKWHHGGRYWTHRYRYRPIGWELYGCIAAGPFWYCP
jgi:Ni/Co efflux regulator RcnB